MKQIRAVRALRLNYGWRGVWVWLRADVRRAIVAHLGTRPGPIPRLNEGGVLPKRPPSRGRTVESRFKP